MPTFRQLPKLYGQPNMVRPSPVSFSEMPQNLAKILGSIGESKVRRLEWKQLKGDGDTRQPSIAAAKNLMRTNKCELQERALVPSGLQT